MEDDIAINELNKNSQEPLMTDNLIEAPSLSGKKPKSRVLGISAAIVILILFGYVGYPQIQLQRAMATVIKEDNRNEGIKVSVHYKNYYDSSVLIYDLKEIPGDKSMLDIFRVFLQYADKTQNKDFHTVELSCNGTTKFLLDGSDYKVIGQEYSFQNPMYTIRTFPEKLKTPQGDAAFESWSGGILGVLGQQMNDFNSFMTQWIGTID
ncbi:MAG: hypothetical protein ACM3PE_10880 [Deltaproteobacteria bacterium]